MIQITIRESGGVLEIESAGHATKPKKSGFSEEAVEAIQACAAVSVLLVGLFSRMFIYGGTWAGDRSGYARVIVPAIPSERAEGEFVVFALKLLASNYEQHISLREVRCTAESEKESAL